MVAFRKHHFVPSRSDSDWRAAKAHRNFAGFIFLCYQSTIPDPDGGIFGLPEDYKQRVRNINKGMPLFLFNCSNRRLYGVFEAASDGGYNIDPFAWEEKEQSKSLRCTTPVSKFPAQVRVSIKAQRPALVEETFRPYLDEEEGSEFKVELSASQVQQLLFLFETAQAAIKECPLERNRLNRKVRHDPESPRSTARADLDSYSDSSSRGLSSCEDECTDEAACSYQRGEAGKVVSQRLHQIALVGDDHPHGRGHSIPPLEDCIGLDYWNNIETWKRPSQRPARCSESDPNRAILSRLQETDPAVNSNSDHCLESGVDQTSALSSQDDDSTLPMMSSPQLQFCLLKVPFQQEENASLPGQSIRSKRSDQRKFSRGRLINSHKPGFNQDKSHKLKLPQHAPVQLPRPPFKEMFSDLCYQGCGQAQQDPPQLPAPLSPSSLPPTNEGHTFGWQQTGEESGQGLGVTKLMHVTPEELQHFIQNGHAPHHLMPPVLARPMIAPQPITAGFVEALHFEVLEFARCTRPSQEVQRHVAAAIDCVRKGVKTVWPEADVEVFGSFATGLCLQHSDVDLVVIDASSTLSAEDNLKAQTPASLIRELGRALESYEWCESIKPLDTASMPVLKCLCRPFAVSADAPTAIASVAVDITIGGMRNSHSPRSPAAQALDVADHVPMPGKFVGRHTGGAAREYVFHKIQELPALAPLVLLLKAFLHHQNLSDVYTGGLGSFSLTLLVAFFLERVAIASEVFSNRSSGDLPTSCTFSPASCASELLDDSNAPNSSCCFGASNWDGGIDCRFHSLGERYVKRAADAIERVLSLWDKDGSLYLGTLLLGFLQTFGAQLDLSREKIVLKGIDGGLGGFCKRDDRHVALWIDDPLRPGVNIGGGSFGMVHVQKAFRDMLQLLLQNPVPFSPLKCKDKDCKDLDAMSQLAHIGRIVRVADDI